MSGKQTVDLEEVVNEHQGLVKSIVKRFSVSAFDQDDLMQAGFMGLIDAFKRFNPEKGYAFSTYATPFILGAIKKELKNQEILPISQHFRKIVKKVQSSSPLLSIEELTNHCQTSRENIILALNYQPQVVSLDEELLDQIPSIHDWTISLASELSYLSSIDREIFQLKYFHHWTQKKIAQKIGINQSSVCRRLHKMVSMLIK